ncbi:MAG: hypothetical protein ABI763_16130 [Bacteroidota bacterium]
MQQKFFERPYIAFLPFLFLYLVLILVQNVDPLIGDEGRYLQFAGNLLNGFYSPPPPAINLWNGPGFPIYLLPFVAFALPHLVIKLFNAFLYYGVLILFYKTLSGFLNRKKAFYFSLLFACYYMPYKSLPYILSETLTIFLIAAITYCAFVYFSSPGKTISRRYNLLLPILLALLALTKVIFGPVYLAAAIVFLVLYLVTKNGMYKRSFLLVMYAMLFCAPYLLYTWSLTGKIFYWSNAGGKSLYWMSNPTNGEWGEWHNDSLSSPVMNENSLAKLNFNHRKDLDYVNQFTGAERDQKFKELAIRNIREYPGKFFVNWLANWSRMFFNYPVSYTPFRWSTLGNMVANIPALILLAYTALLTWRNKNNFPFALKFLLCISGVYLMGSSFLSAYDRMFYILAPLLAAWICHSLAIFRTGKTEN